MEKVMSGPGILTIEIATALYAVSCGWTSDKHGSAHLVMSPAAMPAGVQTLDGGSDSFPNSGSGNASGQGGSRGESLPPAAPSGMPTLSCPDVAAWRPSSDCLGTPTTLASSPGALTVLWASEDGIYFGGEGQATSPTSDNGFLDLAPSDGTSIKEVWKGPGIPIGGASIGGTAFLASYGSRNGYVYDLALSPKDPLLSGFWGMGTNFASTAAGQAWYWMEATNDLANLYEADLAGTTRYLA